MKYDISTIKNCLNTLQTLTNCSSWNVIYDTYKYTYPNHPDETREAIIRQNDIKLNVISEDLYFVLMHVTTSANDCKDIKNNGIHDLEWVLKHDTELKQFLSDNHICFEIPNRKMYINNDAFDISNDCNGVGFKIFKDKDICACFQINKKYPYGGDVHKRPEILHNINKYVSDKDLSYNWYTTHTPYVVTFQVPYSNMDIALQMSVKDEGEEKILNGLLNWAIDIFFYRNCRSDRIGILKRDVFVPPTDIISIIEY